MALDIRGELVYLRRAMPRRPIWWDWELEFTPHLEKRMDDRGFTEVELRGMLERARSYRTGLEPGRFVVETKLSGRKWEIVVEPDVIDSLLVVITAYRIDS